MSRCWRRVAGVAVRKWGQQRDATLLTCYIKVRERDACITCLTRVHGCGERYRGEPPCHRSPPCASDGHHSYGEPSLHCIHDGWKVLQKSSLPMFQQTEERASGAPPRLIMTRYTDFLSELFANSMQLSISLHCPTFEALLMLILFLLEMGRYGHPDIRPYPMPRILNCR